MTNSPSVEQTATSIVVSATVTAAPEAVWALLSDPARHVEIDGSGNLRGLAEGGVVTAVGQTFLMDMTRPELGDYQTLNAVVAFEAGRSLAWTVTRPPYPASGFFWRWDVVPSGTGTLVTQTYDWAAVTDPAVLARVSFPRITPEEMLATVDRLAAAAEVTADGG